MPTARLPIDAAHRAASSDAHAIGAVTGLTDALADGRSEVLSSVTLLSTDHPATWTADAATDVLTSSVAHGFIVNTPIAFGAGTGALPAGLAAEPEYYWVVAVPTTTTMQVSLTYGGAAVDITDAGTAGWVVRILPSGSGAAGILVDGFSLNAQSSIDLIFAASFARSYAYAVPWLATGTSGDKFYSSCTGGVSSSTYSNNATLTKKYNKALIRMRLDLISTGVAAFELGFYALQADNAAYTSGRTGITRQDGGILTFGGDITQMRLYDPNGPGRFLAGATGIAVRRP